MLPYVLGLFGVTLAVLVVRWVLGRSAPILMSICAIVLVGGGVIELRWDMQEHDFTVATQKLLGRKDVHVQCQRLTGTLIDASGTEGHVMFYPDGRPPRLAHLTYTTCHNLAKWRRGGHKATAPNAQLIAVHVLTHEAMHLTGVTNEATAECYAIQRDSQTAQLLGASRSAGDALALRYWSADYPNMRDDYRTSDCRPGGALDLHPDTPDWPTG